MCATRKPPASAGQPGTPASVSWRSSSTPTSSTPTGSSTSRCPRSSRPCPTGTVGCASTDRLWRRCNGNPRRPGGEPERGHAALRLGRARRPAQGGRRRRGPLLGCLHTRPGPTGDDRRRSRRTPGPLAQPADRVLRDPALAEEWTYRYLASLRPEDRSPRDSLPGLTYSVSGPSFAWSARSSRTRCWVRTSRMVVTNPTPPTRLPNADQPSAPNQSR